MTLPERIKAIRLQAGMNQAQFADAIGASQGSVSKWERGVERPEMDSLRKISAFASDPGFDKWLGDQTGVRPRMVPKVGYVGAGAEAHYYGDAHEPGPDDMVEAPDGSTEHTVAVEIRGDSLGSFFDRWLVYYDHVERPATADLVNKLCVVGLANGQVLVKKLRRGSKRGRWHLFGQFSDPILDAEVVWAARVKNMVPQ